VTAISYTNVIFVILGWALNEFGKWLQYHREVSLELKKKEWQKSKTFITLPRAWDKVFSQDQCYWLFITLKDGTVFGGYYGSLSCAASYPHDNDLYVQDVWNISNGETYEKHVNRGLLIERNNILHMEISQVEEGNDK
jgi:hypothetical protein